MTNSLLVLCDARRQGHTLGSGFSRHLPVVLELGAEAELEIQVRSSKVWLRSWSARWACGIKKQNKQTVQRPGCQAEAEDVT